MKALLSIFEKDNQEAIEQLKEEQFKVNILEVQQGTIPSDYILCLIFFEDYQESFLRETMNRFAFDKKQLQVAKGVYKKIGNINFNIPIILMSEIFTNN